MPPLSFEDVLNNDRALMDGLVPIKTTDTNTDNNEPVPSFDDLEDGFIATKPILTRTISHASLDAHDTDIEQKGDVSTPTKSPSLAPTEATRAESDHNQIKSNTTSQATIDAAHYDVDKDITSVGPKPTPTSTPIKHPKVVSHIRKQKYTKAKKTVTTIMDWRKKLYYSPDITPLPTPTPIRVETLELLLKLAREPVYV